MWVVLFVISACLAGAETAITCVPASLRFCTMYFSLFLLLETIAYRRTLWPWKVKKIAEEEGPDSPFRSNLALFSHILSNS